MKKYKNKEWLKKAYEEKVYANVIGRECGVTRDTIEYWRKKFNIPKNENRLQSSRTHFYNTRFFKTIDSEEKAYWLGFLMADGAISRSGKNKPYNRIDINLKIEDKEHLVKFQESIGSTYTINEKFIENKKLDFSSSICHLRINSIDMAKDLMNLGVHPQKTGKETFIKIPNLPLERHFLRGFFDGDGSLINSAFLRFNIGSASKSMLEEINNHLLSNIGVDFSIYEEKQYGIPFFKIDSQCRPKNKAFLEYIYKDSTVYLKRKYDLYSKLKNKS